MAIDEFIDILEWIGYLFASIGFGATVYKTVEVWLSLQRFSWDEVDKYSKRLIKQITDDHYSPDLIVTIGRGGAIVGAILSGNLPKLDKLLKNIPLLGVDRIYQWKDGQRLEVKNEMIDFKPLENKKVLLVASDVITGGTMKFFLNEICAIEVADLRTACLVKGATATLTPNYWGKEIPANFTMPWMYKGHGYIRDSRRPPTKKSKRVKIWLGKFLGSANRSQKLEMAQGEQCDLPENENTP